MVGLVITLLPTSIISRHGCRRSKWSPPSKCCSADGGWCGGGGAVVVRQGGDPALGETFRSPSKFTRGLNPTPSFSPEAETLALPWWSRSQGTRSHVTPRRARCYPVSARNQSGGCFVPAHEGRGTHPLVTWGVREPTNLLAPPGQASRPARGSNTFRWRHLASEEEEFGAVLPLPHDGGRRDP